jgi:hypothetical protein
MNLELRLVAGGLQILYDFVHVRHDGLSIASKSTSRVSIPSCRAAALT